MRTVVPGTEAVSAHDHGDEKRQREVKIDRAIYLVDDEVRTYRFWKRNPRWQVLDPGINDVNKRSIDGYTRMFRNGTTRAYRYRC